MLQCYVWPLKKRWLGGDKIQHKKRSSWQRLYLSCLCTCMCMPGNEKVPASTARISLMGVEYLDQKSGKRRMRIKHFITPLLFLLDLLFCCSVFSVVCSLSPGTTLLPWLSLSIPHNPLPFPLWAALFVVDVRLVCDCWRCCFCSCSYHSFLHLPSPLFLSFRSCIHAFVTPRMFIIFLYLSFFLPLPFFFCLFLYFVSVPHRPQSLLVALSYLPLSPSFLPLSVVFAISNPHFLRITNKKRNKSHQLLSSEHYCAVFLSPPTLNNIANPCHQSISSASATRSKSSF